MKKIMVLCFATIALLCGQISAQTIVHYNVDDKKVGGIPDFKGTVVGICFVGNLSEETKTLLMKKLGVRDFTEGPRHCDTIDRPIISISVGAPYKGGQAYGSLGIGSYSGELYTMPVTVQLRDPAGHITLLGSAYESALAGTTNDGWESRNLSPDLAAGRSAQLGIYHLFKKGKGWMPGAREAVRAAYNQPPSKK